MAENDQDRALVRRCLRGDSAAFGALVARYERPIFNAVLAVGAEGDEAMVMCEAIFIRVFQRLNTFDQSQNFRTWLFSIAVTETLNRMKTHKRWEPLTEEWASAEGAFRMTAQQRELQHALLMLDMKHRIVVIVYHFLQLPYDQAAQVLSLPEKTFKSRLQSAHHMLWELLEEHHARDDDEVVRLLGMLPQAEPPGVLRRNVTQRVRAGGYIASAAARSRTRVMIVALCVAGAALLGVLVTNLPAPQRRATAAAALPSTSQYRTDKVTLTVERQSAGVVLLQPVVVTPGTVTIRWDPLGASLLSAAGGVATSDQATFEINSPSQQVSLALRTSQPKPVAVEFNGREMMRIIVP